MPISQLDITSAYLHGEMDNIVHLEAPELLEEMLTRIAKDKSDRDTRNKAKVMLTHLQQGRRVCLLRKALYGLRQSGCQWHSKLNTALKGAGLISTNADPCVYVNKKKTLHSRLRR
ncbi:hypothetical protein RF55_12478 [Lasius niger]|uniref:Reverse transcriptase Ty1/copia-type domain-containing protein n=1 Tax=Lasius niger TaxID=67767 RepID=A0A0J7KD33_LASNI|nr:hypothetical protein RF55_12478 [Lasius niger]